MSSDSISVEAATRKRYAEAAATVQPELCCASGGYDSRYLEAIPKSVLDVDYGCGDPSKWLGPGETVLDLGSGSGKICFIAAQIVGVEGRVIGVDFNPPMLELARNATAEFVRRTRHDNVEVRTGRTQHRPLGIAPPRAVRVEGSADRERGAVLGVFFGSSGSCVLWLCSVASEKRLSHQGDRRGSKKGPQHRAANPPAVQRPTSALGSHACVALSSGPATR